MIDKENLKFSLQLKIILLKNKSSWETNFAFAFWNPPQTWFVTFSFPKKVLPNRVFVDKSGCDKSEDVLYIYIYIYKIKNDEDKNYEFIFVS